VTERPDYLGPSYDLRTPTEVVPTRGDVLRERARRALWPPRPEAWAALFALAVVALGIHGLWFQATLPDRLPSAIDWKAAAALLARDARPGDVVALAPPWAERAREVLPDRLQQQPDVPLVTLALPRYTQALEDLPGVRRVWLVSLPGAPGASRTIARDLAERSSRIDGPQPLGALTVTRFDLKSPLQVLAFLPDRLGSATVRVGDEPCQPDLRGGLRCPGTPPRRVIREVREVDFLPRVCIRAEPGDPAGPLTLEFSEVLMGSVLRGHLGAPGDAGLGTSAPVTLGVKVDGQEIGLAEEPAHAPGWRAFQFNTDRFAGKRLAVAFEIRSPGPGRPDLCFDAFTTP